MKISIAMCTYNAGRFLREQLSSFLVQTTLPNELVVCDDGSSDETINILKDFAQEAPFEVHIHQNITNLGFSMNFGKALSLCRGDIIFLCDQDDVWFPEKIENVVRVFNEHKDALVVINDAEITDEYLHPTGLTQAGQICNAGFTTDQVINGCFSAVSAKILPLVLPIDCNEIAHDTYIHQLAISMNARVYMKNILQYYRRHAENLSNHFTSSISRVSTWDLFWTIAQIDTRIPLVSQLSMLETMCSRLNQVYLVTEDVVIKKQIKQAIGKLIADQEIIQSRLDILRKPRYKRIPVALGFWLRGGYNTFSGLKSMVKDLVL
jgi:glycosyltransferase involved in cell wall biosynthesis